MYEVEIKVPAALETVRERLVDAGATRRDVIRQRDVYYDAPHRTFAETDEALRIRHETVLAAEGEGSDEDEQWEGDEGGGRWKVDDDGGDRWEVDDDGADRWERGEGGEVNTADTSTAITYKGPLVEAASKTREEFETGVSDPEAAAGILDGLGFEPAATVEKRRERWTLDGATVTLDSVTDVGEFIEIELTAVDAAGIEDARERAIAALDRLGLDADDQLRTSYLELLLAE